MRLLSLSLALVLIWLPGCRTVAQVIDIQPVLNSLLPEDFEGDFSGAHNNPHLKLIIEAKGLKKVDGEWTWNALTYYRLGTMSYGQFAFTPNE